MNPFYNPIFLTRLLKSYLDIDLAWKIDQEQLRKYQDKALRKMVRFSYSTPVYHKKYREAGINPEDIRGIKDIKKLPLITKNDLRDNYPDGIVPKNFDKERGFLLSTSGSTGKPVFVYYDLFSAIKYLEGFVRILKAYGGNWSKSKIALVIDIKPGSVENASFQGSVLPFLKRFVSLNNIKYLYVGEKIEKLIKEVNDFNPEYLGSDPTTLNEFAYIKNNGQAKNVNPRLIFSSGSMLDDYTRHYVEKAFNARVLDNYGSTEAGPIGFECIDGDGYHINSDFIYTEFLDDNQNDVPYNTPGKLVVTRLYGFGTPIIRYTGVEDIVTPIKPHDCGFASQMIKNIGGRSIDIICLPSGKTIAPFHVTTIPASVMDDYKTYKIKQFQIIQNRLDDIEVKISIDSKLRNIGPSVEKLIEELYNRFKKVTGPEVNITIKEVDEVEKDPKSGHVKVVISRINKK